MISAKILADSISTAGYRVTTMQVVMPRIILAEINTHRVMSRSSASSRAIPVEKQLKRFTEELFYPVSWGRNQRGMQADQDLGDDDQLKAEIVWSQLAHHVEFGVRALVDLGVHKQIANRWLEPGMYHTAIITATEWDNFFNLRRDKAAQPEMQATANAMWTAREESIPWLLLEGDWHLPLVTGVDEDLLREHGYDGYQLARISSARCARISYMTMEGKIDPVADLALAERLMSNGHYSPLEHALRPMTEAELLLTQRPTFYFEGTGELRAGVPNTHFLGNVSGWIQYRKYLEDEAVLQK